MNKYKKPEAKLVSLSLLSSLTEPGIDLGHKSDLGGGGSGEGYDEDW